MQSLTVSLPAHLTAATGVDALTHCIESFTSPVLHPLCDGIALEGIGMVAQHCLNAVQEPDNLESRQGMLLAAMMGGIAFQKDLGSTLHGTSPFQPLPFASWPRQCPLLECCHAMECQQETRSLRKGRYGGRTIL